MCGIFAILTLKPSESDPETWKDMSQSIEHRGPDDQGYALFELEREQLPVTFKEINPEVQGQRRGGSLLLGHRRLSIIDLSSSGHQPMCNETGSLWIVFNGEIYNYLELKDELLKKGHFFRSTSDTEVILHAYEEWGEECLNRFNGMWAFALWDVKRKRLFCSRDRFGIKPLYYYSNGKRFVLASEIKAILQDNAIRRVENQARVYDYLAYGDLDHSEETLFQNIRQLPGAHSLVLDVEREAFRFRTFRYWDLDYRERSETGGVEDTFFDLLEKSIQLHMRSDVPVGTCLSGGLDSSSIVCLTKRFLRANVHKTFSACFDEKKYNERHFVEEVVELTRPDPYFVYPRAEDLFDDLRSLIWFQDEPFGSTSIYAQWKVFELAKKHDVKVILDGQGADELLAGYHPYFGYFLSELLRTFQLGRFFGEYGKIRKLYQYSHVWFLSHLAVSLFPPGVVDCLRRGALSYTAGWLRNDARPDHRTRRERRFRNLLFDRLYHSLTRGILPALLHYEDRNSMAHSIEARVPFLDYRLVEFVFTLPMSKIIRDGTTKMILRESMRGVLPESIRNRRDKMGFGTPAETWFRTVLREPFRDILSSKSFEDRGYCDVRKIKESFDTFCGGKNLMSSTVWRWINLELWFRMFIDQKPRGGDNP